VTWLAAAWGAGIGLGLAGLPTGPALLLPLLLLVPLQPWRRPGGSLPLLAVVAVAGVLAGGGARAKSASDCRLELPREGRWTVVGRFEARVEPGRAGPFRVEAGLPGGCRASIRAAWPRDLPPPPTGVRLELQGRWEGRSFPEPGRGAWAGRLLVQSGPEPVRVEGGDLHGRLLRLRGAVQDRIHRLWGARAPMVEALVLARREHLDPDLRAAFGRTGTAHLLAISGFHVGVVAGILLSLLRIGGVRPARAAAGAAAGSWIYVLGIGAPHAALRAAVILTLLAAARVRGSPSNAVGTLSTAFLLLLLLDPSSLASVGFQLSFAGTLGLVTLRRPLEGWIEAGWRRLGWEAPRKGPSATTSDRWLRGSSDGVVAGVAATLPTLPLLAWHFDQVSVVGVPATLTVSAAVALAIPGIAASLLLSLLLPPLGSFLAGGTGLLLAAVERMILGWDALPWAAIWVSRPALLTVLVVGTATGWWLRRTRAGRIRAPARRALAASAAATAILLLPLVPLDRNLDLHVIDVGQGDAFALRLPGGRWIAVDAGPAGPGWDAGARRVVPYLRRHGARRLEALVLTHAHLDHLGGARAVLDDLPTRGVLEPARVTASDAYLQAMRAAARQGSSWWAAETGQRFVRGGVALEILHPLPAVRPEGVGSGADEGPRADPNRVSVVLLVQYGASSILFTGDAYAEVETAVLDRIPAPLTVLKVGHHGSRTSTSEALIRAVAPRVAVIPTGDGNRYGHPHPEVVERLEAAGAEIRRTDRDGSFRIRLRPDGRWRIVGGG
jgi:competence protein ComEC